MKKKEGEDLKRFLMMLFVGALLLGAILSVNVFAEKETKFSGVLTRTYEQNSGPSYEALSQYADMDSLRATLEEAIAECEANIDISAYQIPSSLVSDLAFYIWKDMPTSFHVAEMSYSANSRGIYELYLGYSLSKSEYQQYLQQCQDAAATMLAGLDAPGLTDMEKALILHDRLAVYNQYDTTYSGPYTHDMPGVFIYRTSVCEGYAKAYSYLLDQVGIRNYYVSSDILNHGWNIVYIDGEKYHVDVTWDDPLYDRVGRVNHDNFLRSTDGIVATGHHDHGACDFDSTPKDTRYDDAFWQESKTAFQVIDGEIYYVDPTESGVKLMQMRDGDAHQVLADVSDAWRTDHGNWGDGYQILSSDGVDLLYSTGDKIYRYCLQSRTSQVVWTPALPSGTAIFGFAYLDGKLTAIYNNSPNFTENTNNTNRLELAYAPHIHAHDHRYDDACDSTCNICSESRKAPHVYDGQSDLTCNLCGYTRPAFVPGDLDGVEGITLDDAIYFLFHVNFPDLYPVNQPVNFDGKGGIDLDDAIYFLFHVNFPEFYPLH